MKNIDKFICPCFNCLCKGICKYKALDNLIEECSIVKEWVDFKGKALYPYENQHYNSMNYNLSKLRELYFTLQPNRWRFDNQR
jgi:hypothetical protein